MQVNQYVLGIELGGSHATVGVADRSRVLDRKRFDVAPQSTLTSILPLLREQLHLLLRNHHFQLAECAGLGMAFCGLVDVERNRPWCIGEKYNDALDLDLTKWSRDNFSLPFRMDNDVRLALMGESLGGAARGCADVVLIQLGTGFGTAAIMLGQPVRGRYSLAAARGGHFSTTLTQTPCFCGNVGCVETEASTWRLEEISRRPEFQPTPGVKTLTFRNFRELLHAVQEGAQHAKRLLDHCIRVWGASTITLVHAYDANTVILGGGIMRSPIVFPLLADYIRRHSWTPWGTLDVRRAELDDDAAILGTTSLFL